MQPLEVVLVRLGGARYTLTMDAVAEVGRPPALTRVPGLPGWVAGVANWRGRVLAVLDVRALLDGAATALDRRGRLVVLRHDGVVVGLLTEAVEGTRRLDPDDIETASPRLAERSGGLLSGQLTDAEGPCGVLDLAAVLRLADALPRVRRAS